MPKRSTPVRSGVQRNKPKAQKGFELVRPTSQALELDEVHNIEQPTLENNSEIEMANEAAPVVPLSKATSPSSRTTATKERERVEDISAIPQRRSRGRATPVASATSTADELDSLPPVPQGREDKVSSTSNSTAASVVAKGSAAERLAARRQGSQRAQQRNPAMLVTAEHYSYVKRDLMLIAILALIMFIVIIALYFVPGI